MSIDRIMKLADDYADGKHTKGHFGALREMLCASIDAALSEERERIAQHFDSRDKGVGGFYDPHEPAEIIRALGPNVEVEAPLTAQAACTSTRPARTPGTP